MENKKIVKIILILLIVLTIIDQTSKFFIYKFVSNDIVILQNVFVISEIQSSNLEFNKQSFTNIALIFLILIVVIRFIIIQKHNLKKSTTVFLGMIISGEFSNLLDIIFRGTILEFIQIGDFPTINLADCFIIVGWILFIIHLFKEMQDVKVV